MPTVRTGDIATYYEDGGEGPAVVLLHAATLDHASWSHQVEDLRRDHRVVAYDLRGHGRSGGSAHAAYSAELMAGDLHHLLQALRLERPALCGLSLGGMVALTYASRHPGAIAGLVLAGTPTPPLLSAAERLQRAVLPRILLGPVRLLGYERLKGFLMRAQARVHGDEAMGTFTARDLPPMSTAEFAKAVRAFASFHRTAVDLGAIRAPTLVLHGDREPPFIPRHARRIREAVPGARVEVLAGAGHASSLDQPAAFTAALRGFLAEVHGAPAAPAARARAAPR